MGYELWDGRSGNLVGGWDTEDEALGRVRQVRETEGGEAVDDLVLAQEDGYGHTLTVSEEAALLRRAHRAR